MEESPDQRVKLIEPKEKIMRNYYSILQLKAMDGDDLRNLADQYGLTYDSGTRSYQLILMLASAQRSYFDKTFEVEMTAYQNGAIREVKVPSAELDGNKWHELERIFYWGQNDFQQVSRRYSVSVGDHVRYKGERYRVEPMGFQFAGDLPE